jgi:hypothetical protein
MKMLPLSGNEIFGATQTLRYLHRRCKVRLSCGLAMVIDSRLNLKCDENELTGLSWSSMIWLENSDQD